MEEKKESGIETMPLWFQIIYFLGSIAQIVLFVYIVIRWKNL